MVAFSDIVRNTYSSAEKKSCSAGKGNSQKEGKEVVGNGVVRKNYSEVSKKSCIKTTHRTDYALAKNGLEETIEQSME
jgi:hypothetical protein